MTYDQLRILDAIITHGSFRAASKFLFLSQPSVSVAIKKLEEEFNLKLFSRDQYRPILTPEGKVFYHKAKTVLNQTEALEVLGKQLAKGDEPEVRIAIDAACPLPFIAKLLKKFEKEYSSTKLILDTEYMGGVEERVLDKSADLGIIALLNENPKLESTPLTSITMMPVSTPKFFPDDIKKDMDHNSVRDFVQVINKDSSFKQLFQKSHGILEGGRQWRVNDFFTKKQLILAGLGWGRLPQHLIEDELNSGELVCLDIKTVRTADVEIQVVRNINQPAGPIVTSMWEDFQKISDL
jgi:DNA-binding transcriptional LysR family regulator